MKNRFTITESEKKRILSLHEQITSTSEKPNPVTPVVATTVNADIVKGLQTMKTTTPAYATTIDMAIKLLTSPTAPQISKTSTPDDILKLITPLFPDPTILEFVKTAITTAVPSMIFPKVTPPVVASTPVQLGVKNPKIVTIQTLLNTKYQSGLTPDGKWGPKTAAAIKAAFDKIGLTKPEALKPAEGEVKPGTEVKPAEVKPAEVKPETEVASSGSGETVKVGGSTI